MENGYYVMIYRYLTSVFADQNASPRTIWASKKKNKHTQIILDCLLKEEVYVALVKSSARRHAHKERENTFYNYRKGLFCYLVLFLKLQLLCFRLIVLIISVIMVFSLIPSTAIFFSSVNI